MKTVLTLIVIGLLTSCFATDRQFPASILLTAPLPTPTQDRQSPMSYEQMLPRVASLSKYTGMPNLRDAKLSDTQTELRLWRGVGLVFPRCFILKIDNDKPFAYFASPKVVGDKVVFGKEYPVYTNMPLNAPPSGWATFLTFLKDNGIETSINLMLDKHYTSYPDQGFLILEMKTGSRHTLAHYIDSTVTVDGKKAFAVCEKIQDDFDVQLTCKR